jgi:hypothetical protein
MTVVRERSSSLRAQCSVHGSSFLGFSWQDNRENVILPDGTDLRGYRTVEGRLRQALQSLFPKTDSDDSKDGGNGFGYENIQVSSRTDRGVHALKNTLHVDLWNRNDNLTTQQIHRGVNYFLSRQRELQTNNGIDNDENDPKAPSSTPSAWRNQVVMVKAGDTTMNELRVLNVRKFPAGQSWCGCGMQSTFSSSGRGGLVPGLRHPTTLHVPFSVLMVCTTTTTTTTTATI